MNDNLYERLMSHMPYHDVKGWLLRGARTEDAQTIFRAIMQISDEVLKRRLARALAKDR